MRRLPQILLLLLLLLSGSPLPAQVTLSGGASLTGGAATRYIGTDYAFCDFEASTFCQFQPYSDDGTPPSPDPVITTDFAHSGTKSAKTEVVVGTGTFQSDIAWIARNVAPYNHTGPKNPALTEPFGITTEMWFLLPQATIDHIAAADRQMKMPRSRFDFDLPNGGFIVGTFGQNSGAFPFDQWRSVNETGDPEDYDFEIGTNGNSNITLVGATWYHWIMNCKHNGTTGRCKAWINGTLVFDTGQRAYLGRTQTTAEQSFQFGQSGTSGVAITQNVLLYVDDLKVTTSDISP